MHEFHRPPRWKDSELLIPCSKLSQNEQDLGFYGLSRLWLSAFWSELPFTLLWWFKAGEEIFSFYATAWVWRMCKKGTAETGIRKVLQKTGIRYVAASKSRPKKAAAICLAWCFLTRASISEALHRPPGVTFSCTRCLLWQTLLLFFLEQAKQYTFRIHAQFYPA